MRATAFLQPRVGRPLNFKHARRRDAPAVRCDQIATPNRISQSSFNIIPAAAALGRTRGFAVQILYAGNCFALGEM